MPPGRAGRAINELPSPSPERQALLGAQSFNNIAFSRGDALNKILQPIANEVPMINVGAVGDQVAVGAIVSFRRGNYICDAAKTLRRAIANTSKVLNSLVDKASENHRRYTE